jgi:hypothetical protein
MDIGWIIALFVAFMLLVIVPRVIRLIQRRNVVTTVDRNRHINTTVLMLLKEFNLPERHMEQSDIVKNFVGASGCHACELHISDSLRFLAKESYVVITAKRNARKTYGLMMKGIEQLEHDTDLLHFEPVAHAKRNARSTLHEHR